MILSKRLQSADHERIRQAVGSVNAVEFSGHAPGTLKLAMVLTRTEYVQNGVAVENADFHFEPCSDASGLTTSDFSSLLTEMMDGQRHQGSSESGRRFPARK